MKTEMFDIVNYDVWGDLVKKWARDKWSRPANIEQFKNQLREAGVEATYPREFTDLVFIEASSTEGPLIIKLPPRNILDQAEMELAGSNYPLPSFYTDALKDCNLKDNTKEERLAFHSRRVGEYTIKFCG